MLDSFCNLLVCTIFVIMIGRITGCRDHPDVLKVCAKAKEACFCAEHEAYTYAYCRKSCKFCDVKYRGMIFKTYF